MTRFTSIIARICLAAAAVAVAAPTFADDVIETFLLRTQPQKLDAVLARYELSLLATLETPAGPLHQVRCPPEPNDDDDDDDDDDEPGDECSDALVLAISGDPDVVLFEEDDELSTPEVPGNDPGGTPADLADALAQQGLVDYYGTPVWTGYAQQSQLTGIGLQDAHALTRGAGVVVAVIDGGIDATHPVLTAAVVAGYDFLTDTSPVQSELNTLDEVTRGVLDQSRQAILEQDQVIGLGPGTQAVVSAAAAQALDPGAVPVGFGHGTMVAGLIRLVAPEATLLPLRAFGPEGTGTVFNVLRAIYYGVDSGAHVLNMSFTLPTSSTELERAIAHAASRGVISIAAAGNEAIDVLRYPAALPAVIGVGSVDATRNRSAFSNYGPTLVAIAAPGEGLVTTFPGGNYAGVWGTSFSTAVIAGTTTLMVALDPTLSQTTATAAIVRTATAGVEPGTGLVNVADALVDVAQQAAAAGPVTR